MDIIVKNDRGHVHTDPMTRDFRTYYLDSENIIFPKYRNN
jgi:hypothetical protein